MTGVFLLKGQYKIIPQLASTMDTLVDQFLSRVENCDPPGIPNVSPSPYGFLQAFVYVPMLRLSLKYCWETEVQRQSQG